jgi:2-haloacid dehalogenase
MPPRGEALAFDMYSTLVDTIGISRQIEQFLPQQGQRVSLLWRQSQLEFSFRATLMERYEDFAQLTRKALGYALAATGNTLTAEQQETLLAQYQRLEPFADVKPGLERLQAAGYTMVIFSNGALSMLNPLLDAAGLRPYFQDIISAEEVRIYKPSPRIYHHAAQRLGRTPAETRLISANPFDVTGALAAGLKAAWVKRASAPADPLGWLPDIVVPGIAELAEALEELQR